MQERHSPRLHTHAERLEARGFHRQMMVNLQEPDCREVLSQLGLSLPMTPYVMGTFLAK